MPDNPLEPGPREYDRINVLVESEVAYWSKEPGVSRERLARAIEEVGCSKTRLPKLPSVASRT
jgi:hypothetical protein